MEMLGLEEIKTAIREKTRTELVELAMELYQMAYENSIQAAGFEKEMAKNKAQIEYLEGLIKELEGDAVVFASKQEAKNETQRKALMVEFLKNTSHGELVKEITNLQNEALSNNYIRKKYSAKAELYENWGRLVELLISAEEELV